MSRRQRTAVITTCTGSKSIANGPGCSCAGCCVEIEKRGALVLSKDEYVIIHDEGTGDKRVEDGRPSGKVVWMNEMDRLMAGPKKALNLTIDQYLVYENTADGTRSVVQGEMMFVPGAFDIPSGGAGYAQDFTTAARPSYNLSKNQYLRIKDQNGVLKIVIGEQRFIPGPHDECLEEDFWYQETEGASWKKMRGVVQTAINVDVHTACMVRDISTGNLTQYHTAGLFFPDHYQKVELVQEKTVLQVFERMAYIDPEGHTTFKSGAKETDRNFFLPPFCKWVEQEWSIDKKKEHKQTVRMKVFDVRPQYMQYQFSCRTVDNVELIVDVSFYWSIMEDAGMQSMIMKTADAPGDICTHARSGIIQCVANKTLLMFIENFNEIVRDGAGVLRLSEDEKAQRREALERQMATLDEQMAKIQLNMDAANAKTVDEDDMNKDSTEDLLRQNVEKMEADLATKRREVHGLRQDHERMSSPEDLTDTFYNERGVDLISVEVLTFKCSNPETDQTLQEIIKETADRLKNIEKARGENQVAMTKMEGEIDLQQKNAELIRIKKSHMIIEQAIEGKAEAAKITAFMKDLAEVPGLSDIKEAKEMFKINRKLDSLNTLANGKSTMYISHQDVALHSGEMAFENRSR